MQKEIIVRKATQLPDGKTGYYWEVNEKPCLNHWYRTQDGIDFWKITKDYYSPQRRETFYNIVEYYNGDILFSGHSLKSCREILKENTYRVVN